MRSSPLSHAAESVFKYDLQRELEDDLDWLRKNACDDGDAVFILPDQSFVWVHSPLFYIAANKPPVEFGVEAGTSMNDRGILVKMFFVPEEKISEFEEVMVACYTQSNLELLWKAIGGQDLRFQTEHEHMGIDTSHMNTTLPASMLPDFEIHLRDVGREQIDEPSGFSLKIYRFLLDARVDYYRTKTRFGSNSSDATPMSSNLSRTAFTEFSLWTIAMYVYCGMPSTIFGLDPNLKEYIAEPGGDSNLKQKVHCTTSCTGNRLPTEGIEQGLLDIARAANFLLIPELESWAHFQLYRLAHRFQCTGTGCAELLPHIIEAVYHNEITDEWMFNTGITWLVRYENIPTLWKSSLLRLPKVVHLLIEKIKEDSIDLEIGETGESNSHRGGDAIELFVRLWRLEQYTSMTKDSGKWKNELIEPLMGHATAAVVEDLSNSVNSDIFGRFESLVHGRSFSKLAGEDLLHRVIVRMRTESRTEDLEKLIELYENKDPPSPPEKPHRKRDTAPVAKPPSAMGKQGSSPENQLNENFVDHPAADPPRGDDSNTKRNDKAKKPLESRLKGSAPPFIPRGLPMPLGTLDNLENTGGKIDGPTSLFSGKENKSLGTSSSQENCRIPDPKRPLSRSGSEESFREVVTQAKRHGFKLRRTISTPATRAGEGHEMRAENAGNERRFTSPTIGGAIPFRQQMQMSLFYDASR